jgi:hypothetical protein
MKRLGKIRYEFGSGIAGRKKILGTPIRKDKAPFGGEKRQVAD